jgi:uncharacterized protein (TIGR02594 family)
MSTADQRKRMGMAILAFEARRDAKGHLAIYNLPAGDGGGKYEVAGINDRYHKAEADELVALIRAAKYQEAEDYAVEVIAAYTDLVTSWSDDAGVEFYLRDCAFNRGPRGATRILQRAVGVPDDAEVGPQTRGAVVSMSAEQLLSGLRAAREEYERDVVHRDESSKFWRGLVNRWDNALSTARKFSAEKSPLAHDLPVVPTLAARVSWIGALIGATRSWFAKPKLTAVPKPVPEKLAAQQGTSPKSEAAPPWLAQATSYLGFQERGENRGIEEFIARAGCGSVGDPWCAIFVNACLEAVGVRGTRSAMARSFESDTNFVRLSGPSLGAITTMWRGSPSAGIGHVFFYLGENDHGVLALGGNQSDRVCRQYEPRDRVVGYWWPKRVALPTAGKILVKHSPELLAGGSEL